MNQTLIENMTSEEYLHYFGDSKTLEAVEEVQEVREEERAEFKNYGKKLEGLTDNLNNLVDSLHRNPDCQNFQIRPNILEVVRKLEDSDFEADFVNILLQAVSDISNLHEQLNETISEIEDLAFNLSDEG